MATLLTSFRHDSMGESSKFPKSWTFETPDFKTCSMPIKYLQFQVKWTIVFRQTEYESENLLQSLQLSIFRLTFYGKSASRSWIQEKSWKLPPTWLIQQVLLLDAVSGYQPDIRISETKIDVFPTFSMLGKFSWIFVHCGFFYKKSFRNTP